MITTKWQETAAWAQEVTDAIGCPIDAGILDTVIALNALGVHTLASCEGHLDHGIAAPWIDVGAQDVRPLAKEAHIKMVNAFTKQPGKS